MSIGSLLPNIYRSQMKIVLPIVRRNTDSVSGLHQQSSSTSFLSNPPHSFQTKSKNIHV